MLTHTHRTNTPLSRLFLNDFWGLPLSDPESHKSYRPLTTLSFRANHMLHGLWPPGFHAINIFLHSVVSLLFYVLCSTITRSSMASLTASLLFAVHPIHTEVVSKINAIYCKIGKFGNLAIVNCNVKICQC